MSFAIVKVLPDPRHTKENLVLLAGFHARIELVDRSGWSPRG